MHREYFPTSTCIAFLISFESFELSHLSPNTIEHVFSQQHSSPSCLVRAFLSNITATRHNSLSLAVQGNKLGEGPLAQLPVTSSTGEQAGRGPSGTTPRHRQYRETKLGEAPLAQEGTLMCPVTSALASE